MFAEMKDTGERRKCYRCGELKTPEHFAWRNQAKGRHDTFCRACRSAYKKEHYAANRQRYIDRAGRRKRELALERTLYLIEYFRSHPCVDCGETDPVVLEFDHLRDKSFSVGMDLTRRAWQRILDEIEKCEVVCANCHRRRTAMRRGALRARRTHGHRKLMEERAAGIEPVSESLEGSSATSTPRPRGATSLRA
jgi:hypothetical protein